MSTSIKNLRQLAARDVKDHTAIFDSYVVLGRDIDYLAIKFGLDPENIVNLLASISLPSTTFGPVQPFGVLSTAPR